MHTFNGYVLKANNISSALKEIHQQQEKLSNRQARISPSCAPELEKSGVNREGDPYLRKYEWLNCLHIILGNWVTITYLIFDCFASLTEDWRETIFEWAFEEFELSFYQVLSHGTRNVMLGLVKSLPVPPASEG